MGGGGWRVRAEKLPPRVHPFHSSNSTLQPRTIQAATPAQLGLFLCSSRMKATQLNKLVPHTHVPSTEWFYQRVSLYKCFFIPSHPPMSTFNSTRRNSSKFSRQLRSNCGGGQGRVPLLPSREVLSSGRAGLRVSQLPAGRHVRGGH